MKLKVYVNCLVLFFITITLMSSDYPGDGTDRHVQVLASGGFVLEEGDTVGTTNRGLTYFTANNGLQIGKTSTSGYVEFKTPLPIEWQIKLNTDVYLRLKGDLFLAGYMELTGSGYIQGGAHRICLLGPFYLSSDWISAIGNYSIRFSGNGNSIDFGGGGSIRQPNSAYDLEFRNTVLQGVSQGSLESKGDLILYDSTIRLLGDYCFNSAAYLKIYGDVLITGTSVFCLDAPCIIYDDSSLQFDIGSTFSMGTHGSISFADNHTGSIRFNNSTILIGDKNFSVDYGRIIFDNEVVIDDDGNYGEFIINSNGSVDVLGLGRIVLENTTTLSFL